MVRAKFTVSAITTRKHWEGDAFIAEIELQTVHGNSEENKKFFAASPSGQIKLGVLNPDAAKQFTPGQAFYVDFTPAEA